MAIAITYLEKNDTGKPKNTVMIIDRKGNAILKYSKVHTVDFKTEFLQSQEQNLKLQY